MGQPTPPGLCTTTPHFHDRRRHRYDQSRDSIVSQAAGLICPTPISVLGRRREAPRRLTNLVPAASVPHHRSPSASLPVSALLGHALDAACLPCDLSLQ